MTGALEALHSQYPGKYLTNVDVSVPAVFENNPHVTSFSSPDRVIEMKYDINQADHRPIHFLQGFTDHLEQQLGIRLSCNVKRPYLYLTDQERGHCDFKNFWLINAGYKNDFTIKKWRHDYFQEVVDRLAGKITFLQIGEKSHNHKPLRGVIDLIGKTSVRELIRLGYHASGALTPESFLHHLMAAFNKPCVTLLSGFLPRSWIHYHTGTILTHQEAMPCCAEGKGCWKGKVTKCLLPVLGDDSLALCMDMIKVEDVVRAISLYSEAHVTSSCRTLDRQ